MQRRRARIGRGSKQSLLRFLLAACVFAGCWVALGHGFYAHGRITDVDVYQQYGLEIRNGLVPYRDFGVEYPPASLPVFLAPTYVGQPTDLGDYGRWFGWLMAVCGLACLASVAFVRATSVAVAFLAVSPLLVGWLMPTRFDLWPAALVAGATWAFLCDRHRLGWFLLALSFAAKLYAGVLGPLCFVYTLRRAGRHELARALAVGAVTVGAVFGPFVVIAPHGVWGSVWGQFARPLQIESLPASFLATFGHPALELAYSSVSVAGEEWLRVLTGGVQAATLLALWIAFARGQASEARFLRFAAASVCAFVAFGKVLSPQYLIWLVPLVPLVRRRRGLLATGLLAATAVETQYWLSGRRYGLYITTGRYAEFVLARNLALVALLVLLAVPARFARSPAAL